MKSFIVVILLTVIISAGCQQNKQKLRLTVKEGMTEIDNGIVKARFTQTGNTLSQEYFSLNKGEWTLVAESFHPVLPIPPKATQLFNTSLDPKHRFLVSEELNKVSVETKTDNKIILRLTGLDGNTKFQQLVTLENGNDYSISTWRPNLLAFLLNWITSFQPSLSI